MQSSLASKDRLRLYRRCYHDLEEQILDLKANDVTQPQLRMLQAEIQCLEELIMVFTDLDSAIPQQPAAERNDGGDPCLKTFLPSIDGLDLSLVTDMLMLSATSPWTVYVAERKQWDLCYVSPGVRRMLGWRPSELVGNPAWEGCHNDDVPLFQRMLQLKENFKVNVDNRLLYRKLRKDHSYVTVQASGRGIGTRWFAWVEQDVKASSDAVLPIEKKGHSPPVNIAPVAPADGLEKLKARIPCPQATEHFPVGTAYSKNRSTLLPAPQEDALVGSMAPHPPPRPNPPCPAPLAPTAQRQSLPAPNSSAVKNYKNIDGFDLLHGKKVLLVEDDMVNRTVAKRILETIDCKVTVASNGKDALSIMQSAPSVDPATLAEGELVPPQFDLVLMDLLMPVMDGTRCVQIFRDWEELQEPPRQRMLVFAVTANTSDRDMVKCARSGFDEFVSKPLTVEKLLERLTNRTESGL